jgi:hypothetical protein
MSMRTLVQLLIALVVALVGLAVFPGCTLLLAPECDSSADPGFEGCFGNSRNYIDIAQHECDGHKNGSLYGTGSGVFADTSWAFTGEVTGRGEASLDITGLGPGDDDVLPVTATLNHTSGDLTLVAGGDTFVMPASSVCPAEE